MLKFNCGVINIVNMLIKNYVAIGTCFFYSSHQFSSIRFETEEIWAKSLVLRVTKIMLLAMAIEAICKSNSGGSFPIDSNFGYKSE